MSWRRVLLLSLGFVLLLGTVTWFALQRSGAATAIVQRELDRVLVPMTSISGTEVDLGNGRLVVRDLEIADPTRPGTALARTERVDIDIDITPSGALLSLHRVTVTGLVLDLGPRLPTIAQLLHEDEDDRSAGPVPAIEILKGIVRLTVSEELAPIELTNVALSALPTDAPEELPGAQLLKISGSGAIAGLDAPIALEGSLDASSGAVTLFLRFTQQTIDAALLRWLEERLGLDVGEVEIHGVLRELEATFTSTPGADGTTTRLEARGIVSDASVQGEGLPHLRDASVTFVASSDRGGDATVRVEQSTGQGHIDVTAEATALLDEPSLSIRAQGKDLAIDADMRAALQLVPAASRVIDALRPTEGRADIDLFLRNPHLAGGIAEFDMDLREVAMSYVGFAPRENGEGRRRIGFPLPLDKAHGRVRLRENVVLLEQLGARIAESAGGGEVKLSGRIETKAPNGEDTTIDIETKGVAFTSELRSAVNGLLRHDGDLYDRLAPRGKADVSVTIRPESVLPGGWAVTIQPLGATVTWEGFPYRLDDLEGTIQVNEKVARFDLGGIHGEGSIRLHGRIPTDSQESEATGFEVTMDLEGLEIDDELRRAVVVRAPAIDQHWTDCAATGRCSGSARAWSNGGDAPFELDLRAFVTDADLRLPARPWYARGLSGQITISCKDEFARVDLDSLRGRLEHGSGASAQLAMLGTIACRDTTVSDLSLVVRDLRLDGQLGRTLEELGALGPGVWDYLRPSGAVDLVCRHELTDEGGDDLDLTVHLLDVGSDAPILPRPARGMTGELRVADGRLSFGELRADLDGHLVQCRNGVVASGTDEDPRTDIKFVVSATGFPLDGNLANLFSGPLHDAIIDRDLSGSADIDELSLRFRVPSDESDLPFETILSGKMRLSNVGMRLGSSEDSLRVDALHGAIELEESRVGDDGGSLRGSLEDAALRILDQPFEAIDADFLANAERLQLDRLATRLHGGSVSSGSVEAPAVRFLLPGPGAPDGSLSANLAFESVDAHSFLRSAGQDNTPYRGMASGRFELERLDGQNVVDAEGTGTLTVTNGDLGAVPLFKAIYSFLPAPERPRFDGLDVTWRLTERRVRFDSLSLSSDILGADGAGTLDLDGYLDVKLKLQNLLGNTADPLLRPFVDWFTRNIVRFHLFGHLRDLRAEQRWVTEGSPGRPPVPPLPPLTVRRRWLDF